MEGPMEREAGALGGLFQQIIQDMKNGMPLWEDLITKAMKLHSSLKATILAVTAYLEAFQKIADAATNARGATREIGTALTRICLRHKAVETRMKTFTCTIMEFLVQPLQEKLEDWRKTVINLDKDHARDYKRARAELKKRSTDTLRLQKKVRKGVISSTATGMGASTIGSSGDLQKRLEYGLADVTERRQLMEETEKQAVRAALVEERGRFCTFVGFLKPVVDEEVAMLSELSRLQEVITQLDHHTSDPHTLPPASEQVLTDLKSCDTLGGLGGGGGNWGFHHTPPSSPGGSLGSRKSSVCSISSLNSSSSGSGKSPSHVHWQRSLSQPVGRSGTIRLATNSVTSVSSRDSGFTSQDSLYPRPPSSFGTPQVSNMSEGNSSSSSTPCTPFPPGGSVVPTTTSTWPNLQESMQFERAASAIINDRPHTISSAYEKGVHHQRPALTVYTFQSPSTDATLDTISMGDGDNCTTPTSASDNLATTPTANTMPPPPGSPRSLRSSSQLAKPPLPTRCSSLERPIVPAKSLSGIGGVRVLPPGAVQLLEQKVAAAAANAAAAAAAGGGGGGGEYKVAKSVALPSHVARASIPQPTYVNMHELASMAASKAQEMSLPPPATTDYPNTATMAMTTAASVAAAVATVATPPDPSTESSNSESSLESSSGYGSQTTLPFPPVDALVIQENVNCVSVQQMEEIDAVKYCTLPRPGTTFGTHLDRRRPLSMTVVYSGGTLRPLLRRSSIQSNKPPPPIRRTASITNNNRPLTPVEHLPPPPAFLLEPNNVSVATANQQHACAGSSGSSAPKPTTGVNVAETIKALTEQRHTPASPNAMRRTASQSIYQPTGLQQHFQQHMLFQQQHHMSSGNLSMSNASNTAASPGSTSILSSFSSGGSSSNLSSSCTGTGTKLSYVSSDSRGVIYAQPAMFTAGGSPSVVRRIHQQVATRTALRSQSAERKTEGPGGVGSNFIAALSAKLAPNLSPRSGRRHSDDLIRSPTANTAQAHQSKPIIQKGPGHAFLESLNAKLTYQHNLTTPQRATKIRQIINSKTLPDPKLCHESLMDQIKQGATLKRAKIINDRSAPKIY